MRRRIRTTLARVAVFVLTAVSLPLASPSPAAAFGEETFGCRVAPGYDFTWDYYCDNSTDTSGATTYTAGFALLNTSGTYTYSWSIVGSHRGVIVGCTSTSYDCALRMRAGDEAEVTVTYAQNGQSASQSAYAAIYYCPFC